MEGFKGTPGEWRWFTSNSHKRLSSVLSGKDGDVLYAYNDSTGFPMVGCAENDMALIAAAPELLEALQWAMTKIGPYTQRTNSNQAHCDQIDKANAAIAKALGK
ncbi:hypothetical protein [Pantoea dispersa]|uniref:Uncharacterized protein n=1 Tax=Pantoea dispersa TaxID=59814 RepID=A0ABY3A0H4_9GAMM|nr:hypothetical protein [Pantoea dispersa]TQC75582.1 hypothetical protein FK492_06585 [Pantoea dispersa]